MSNEQFDHIENKIREAAMHSEPPFDEKAWEKMEKKLDKGKDRRRPIIWWFLPAFVLIMGGAAFWYWKENPVEIQKQLSSIRYKDHYTGKSELGSPNVSGNSNVQASINISPEKDLPPSSSLVADPVKRNKALRPEEISDSIKNVSLDDFRTPKEMDTRKPVTSNGKRIKRGSNAKMASVITSGNASDGQLDQEIVTGKEKVAGSAGVEMQNLGSTPLATDSTVVFIDTQEKPKTDSLPLPGAKGTNEKKDKKTFKGLYFTASAGPEITAVSLGQANGRNISARFGLGVGYQLNDRFSIQTGFYSVAKKYVAGKDDYDPKDASYLLGVEDLVVDANCRVIEIPLAIKYTLLNRSKTSWFIAAGAAGVIMKKEEYRFTYTAGTYPYNATYTEQKAFTGNRHFLSFAQFSTGMLRTINAKFSVMAEPYLTVPLQGVGEGRVKLFSGGIQFGLKYMPRRK